jgi:hypothetical protein
MILIDDMLKTLVRSNVIIGLIHVIVIIILISFVTLIQYKYMIYAIILNKLYVVNSIHPFLLIIFKEFIFEYPINTAIASTKYIIDDIAKHVIVSIPLSNINLLRIALIPHIIATDNANTISIILYLFELFYYYIIFV